MPRLVYQSKRSRNRVVIITKEAGIIKIQYLNNNKTAYYSPTDFDRIFEQCND